MASARGSLQGDVALGLSCEINRIEEQEGHLRSFGFRTYSDGGFEIDALNGEPGIHSHRWLNHDKDSTDEELINYTLHRLNKFPIVKRQAQLTVVLVLAINQNKIFTAEAKVEGIIPIEASNDRMSGYPYRSLLFLPQIKKFYNEFELTESENKRYNHRRQAIEKLKPAIINYFIC